MQYGFVGLSHLGLNTSIALSSVGFKVLGFDQNAQLISDLKNKKLPLFEPKLEDIFKASSNISFTNDINDLKNCDVVYIAVDIKTNDKNESDVSKILELANLTLPVLKGGAALVIHSQVNPGFTRTHLAEKRKDIEIYYQVEVLIFGQAVDRVLKPERYMVGCENPQKPLHPAYQKLLSHFNCPIMPMRFESAELAKISINLFLSASVTVSNTLAEVAENIGADWGEISPVLRLDKRIGQFAYLEPGLGISGGNLERDLVSVINMANSTGSEPSVVHSFVKNSEYMKQWPLRKLFETTLSKIQNPKITILGLAYKKDTNSVKNSPSIELIKSLKGQVVTAYDPCIKELQEDYSWVNVENNQQTAFSGMQTLILMTPWDEFKSIKISELPTTLKIIIDPYRLLFNYSAEFSKKGIKYLSRGVN